MGLIHNINHKKIENGFIFNALYSAIVFGILFVANDYIDEYIMPYLEKGFHFRSGMKFTIHILLIFSFTWIIAHIMRLIFGWGKTLTG